MFNNFVYKFQDTSAVTKVLMLLKMSFKENDSEFQGPSKMKIEHFVFLSTI